jgi:colanic acid/amylovoran biosynthesis glycosyltransferase
MRIAYLASRYPQVSHTFIQREVGAVRRAGLTVETLAIRRAQPDEVLSRADREEFERTTSLLPVSPTKLISVQVRALRTAPFAYLRTLGTALRLTPGGARGTLWQLFYFAEAILMWSLCAERGIRHVHVHFANVSADVAMLATIFGGRASATETWTWSFTMHGPTEFYDVRHHRLAEKATDADFVVCISDFARSQLMALLPEKAWPKLRVVHCGVDPAIYARPEPAQRAQQGIEVLCVGRLVPEKGQTILLEAIAHLRGAGRDVRCSFVGDGPSRELLETAIRERGLGGAVRLLGSVGQDEIRTAYSEADVFCLPSFAEGVPVVLMEAMSMELPVVTTRIAGIPELVTDGVNGLLVPPGRADELAAALQRLVDDLSLRRRLGARARETVIASFEIDAIGLQLRDLFETFLKTEAEPR